MLQLEQISEAMYLVWNAGVYMLLAGTFFFKLFDVVSLRNVMRMFD